MQMEAFTRTVQMFADPGIPVEIDGESLLMSLNDETVCVSIKTRMGEVFIDDGGQEMSAPEWIVRKLARLSILAQRIKEALKNEASLFIPSSSIVTCSDEDEREEHDSAQATIEILSKEVPGYTAATYLTCDAGGGKTWLIYEVAKRQAQKYIDGESNWLLVPIPLGGRQFLRFDDITAGVLHNKYRFPYLYFESFLALVRLGVIVPAFDGFEEMFVERSSGEAISALSSLLRSLDSAGRVLISARKAYYEFENLDVRDSIFDTMNDIRVSFSKIELNRWRRPQFVAYSQKRKVLNPEALYTTVVSELGADHALVCRPVLVKSLVDLATTSGFQEDLLTALKASKGNYFEVFVEKLIEREVSEKWIDRSGVDKVGLPLIGGREHFMLLGMVALEMWESHTNYLKEDAIQFVADYFSEIYNKNVEQAEQIKKRLYGHALLIPSTVVRRAVEFEHEEFKNFFLGQALATIIKERNPRKKVQLNNYLRTGIMPQDARDAFLRALQQLPEEDRTLCARYLIEVSQEFSSASFAADNIASVILPLLKGNSPKDIVLVNQYFPANILCKNDLNGITFKDCHFAMTSLDGSSLKNVTFERCAFDKLIVKGGPTIENVLLDACEIKAVLRDDHDYLGWVPNECHNRLVQLGVTFKDTRDNGAAAQSSDVHHDFRIESIEKLINSFLRRNAISENLIRVKLGGRAADFIDNVIPDLMRLGIMVKCVASTGNQDYYKFRVPLFKLRNGIVLSNGSYEKLLKVMGKLG